MTIYYPDLSNHQIGLKLQPKTVAVIAKATEGTTYFDPTYNDFKAQAAAQGSAFFAYHFLWSGTPAEAQWAYRHVGKTPLMVDAENMSVNTTVPMILSFVDYYRKLGGVVHTVYLPHWYWQSHLGSPDLRPLAKAGLQLVGSWYTTYTDNGPGWDPYGGVAPVVWQYTDVFTYQGKSVDFNAFKGTVQELTNLFTTGQIKAAPTPAPKPKPVPGPPPVPAIPPYHHSEPMNVGMFVEAMRAIMMDKESGPWNHVNYPGLIRQNGGTYGFIGRMMAKLGMK